MAKKMSHSASTKKKKQTVDMPVDVTKFENAIQVGGIRTGTVDYPNPNGGQQCRVAFVNTGGGLTFTVALDRGGDIVEASYKGTNIVYLTPNDYVPPAYAYNHGPDWLVSWPAGLMTTCGPRYVGEPREEDGVTMGLHGEYSNTPAAVEMVVNPDPVKGRREMLLSLTIKPTCMFGPHFEIRRQIQCQLGVPAIIVHDQVINRTNTKMAHNWLYHCNLGYPLLDAGAKFIFKGRFDTFWDVPAPPAKGVKTPPISKWKRVPEPMKEHIGTGERGLMLDPSPARDGLCHVGLINSKLKLGVEFRYDNAHLPRLANWQHYGPNSYVTGIEPFNGSLFGKAKDNHPKAAQWLEPGASRRYQMGIHIHEGGKALAEFAKYDGDVK